MARVIGIDFGQKHIGIAISDETNTIASCLKPINIKDRASAIKEIANIAEDRGVGEIVVGLPLNMNGTSGPSAQKSSKFAKSLEEILAVPVVMFDERLTTKQGQDILISADLSRRKRKEKIDSLAAQIILQAYLDSKKHA